MALIWLSHLKSSEICTPNSLNCVTRSIFLPSINKDGIWSALALPRIISLVLVWLISILLVQDQLTKYCTLSSMREGVLRSQRISVIVVSSTYLCAELGGLRSSKWTNLWEQARTIKLKHLAVCLELVTELYTTRGFFLATLSRNRDHDKQRIWVGSAVCWSTAAAAPNCSPVRLTFGCQRR